MLALVLAILTSLGTGLMWFGILASDPSNTQASSDAAKRVLMVGGGLAAIFWVVWFLDG